MHFAVTLIRGPRWDTRTPIRHQAGWDRHAAFMDGLVSDGFILVGGPVGDQRQTLHLVVASGEAEARRRWDEDPWVVAGLVQVGSVDPWELWLDFRTGAES